MISSLYIQDLITTAFNCYSIYSVKQEAGHWVGINVSVMSRSHIKEGSVIVPENK